MTTFTVTMAADVVDGNDGRLSLREAVTQANATAARDTIVFAAGIEGQTLTLTGGELVLRHDTTIDGDRDGDGVVVTLSGGDSQRIIRTAGAETAVTLTDMGLTHGYAPRGGAVFVGGGSLTVSGSTVSHNVASGLDGGGGGIFAEDGSRVAVLGSEFLGNDAQRQGGGAIDASSSVVTVRTSAFTGNQGYYGSGAIQMWQGGSLSIADSDLSHNFSSSDSGGAVGIYNVTATIERTTLSHNSAYYYGGAIASSDSSLTIANSTIADNSSLGSYWGIGGGIITYGGTLNVLNSTVTGNSAYGNAGFAEGGGIAIGAETVMSIANSLVLGNSVSSDSGAAADPDISGTIAFSNGHNVFGSDVAGSVPGDREGIAPRLVFAAIDSETGGGLLSDSGVVPLLSAISNPALSGADLLTAPATGQIGGARPLPVGSLPDIGSLEIYQTLSTTASANNDVLTGTAAGNAINGLAGNDYLKGLGGADRLHGNDGSDLLDGGAGNDQLYGDAGIDLVFYGGATKVTIDLSGATDTARRGSETDTLHNVEGAIGSAAADTFKGDLLDNLFQGGLGKDTATGGAGRDLYDFNAVADSKAGAATRDVITDFANLSDRIDVMGIDADGTVAGNQAFHWVGTAAVTGPGEIGYFTTGGNTIIQASSDADAASEFQIQLTGIKTLSEADFYL